MWTTGEKLPRELASRIRNWDKSWFIKLFFGHQKVTSGRKPSWGFVYLTVDKTHYLVVCREGGKGYSERNLSSVSTKGKMRETVKSGRMKAFIYQVVK